MKSVNDNFRIKLKRALISIVFADNFLGKWPMIMLYVFLLL